MLSLITKTFSSDTQTLKIKRFILRIAPSRMLGGNLKMIYANVISLCVIQHSQLMTELPQPNYKLTTLDITVRLMCFSGTCLIAGRLQWGQYELPSFYVWQSELGLRGINNQNNSVIYINFIISFVRLQWGKSMCYMIGKDALSSRNLYLPRTRIAFIDG